ncbi:hypothetical protein BD560DRAFT_425150 [Blakeslea trispora]|nr:hypothetical protein BD560DRAFT_425150 [Blakeslea trispora]
MSTTKQEQTETYETSKDDQEEEEKDEFDGLLERLDSLTVVDTPTQAEQQKTKILAEPHLQSTRFEQRWKQSAIPERRETVKPLTEKENQLVDRLFRKGQSGQVAELRNAMVSYKDIYRLYPETWLNDEIINFYFELISERANKTEQLPQIHCFNTFFCSTLRDQGYAKVDIFQKDLLFVPINQSYHWVLGVMDIKHKKVCVYDSLHGNHDRTLDLFLDYLEKEHLDKKKESLDTSDWIKETPKDIPRQENMSDCGAFTCTFAERLSRAVPFHFSQSDMTTIRRRMALNIVNKAI